MPFISILCLFTCKNGHLMLIENRGFGYFDYKGKGRVAVIILQWKGEGICIMGI